MALILRRAQPADAADMAVIYNAVVRETTHTFTTLERAPADFSERMARGQLHWVAADAGTILGYATFGPFRDGPGYAHTFEHTVYVAPNAAGRGIGRQLLARVEHAVADAGGHCLIAGISGENDAAQAFHRAMGFSEVGRMPQVGRKFSRWHDLVLMQKFLSGTQEPE